jgi:hypothetical protein
MGVSDLARHRRLVAVSIPESVDLVVQAAGEDLVLRCGECRGFIASGPRDQSSLLPLMLGALVSCPHCQAANRLA